MDTAVSEGVGIPADMNMHGPASNPVLITPTLDPPCSPIHVHVPPSADTWHQCAPGLAAGEGGPVQAAPRCVHHRQATANSEQRACVVPQARAGLGSSGGRGALRAICVEPGLLGL